MLALSFYLNKIRTEEDQDKLTVIYNTYLDDMILMARKYVGKYHMEEDIVHSAILQIMRHLDYIDLSVELCAKSYVCTIVKNCSIDWLRKNNRYEVVDLESQAYGLETPAAIPIDFILSKEGYRKLIDCIHSLNDTYRSVCDLKFICGLKEREIAEVLGISEKNVSVRIVRARRLLIEMLMEGKNE